MDAFTVNLLLTKEEYVNEQTKAAPRWTALTPLALLIALFGVAADRLLSLSVNLMWGCVSLGVLLLIYDLLFSPLMRRTGAIARYERQESLRQAVSLTVTEETVTVAAPRFSGRLPEDRLTCRETEDLFVLTAGDEMTLRLPKRQLTGEQQTALRTRFSRKDR